MLTHFQGAMCVPKCSACEPLCMLSPLPISFFLFIFFIYQRNNILIIYKINNTGQFENKRTPSQSHWVSPCSIGVLA